MRESIGNAFLYNFVIIFVIIFIAFLVGSLSYSKAFKLKNNIINIIEDHGNWEDSEEEVSLMLRRIGYSVSPNGISSCPKIEGSEIVHNRNEDYLYCVYLANGDLPQNNKEYRGPYYRVVAYIYFDIPIVNNLIRIPVQGETKNIYQAPTP